MSTLTAAERALADAKAAVEAAEVERRRNDTVIALCDSPNGTLALTATGRVFRHVADPRHANDGVTRVKMIWSEIPGPLA